MKLIKINPSDNVAVAIDTVTAKFPEMSDAFKNAADIMTNSSLSTITKALQGNKEVFDALPEHIKKVVEELYNMNVRAGQSSESVSKLLTAWKDLQQSLSAKQTAKNEFTAFAEELSASVDALVEQLPDNVERMQKFLGSNHLDLAVNLSLSQAQAQIKELSKSIGEKFNLPADIVSADILDKLDRLASSGNKAAQSLVNGWNCAGNSLDTFLAKAQEAITYLGASPDKFIPALNKLSQRIQKIDPLTGKVTEQFKKAYDALKQWGNVTFSNLEQRIQRLRKAVESGFIDQSALEAEFKRVSQQVKLKIAAELEPTRASYQSESVFNSVVASEYVSRMGELGGEAFIKMMQREFAGIYDKSGASIGRAIMREVNNGFNSSTIMKINGVDVSSKSSQTQSIDFKSLGSAVADSVKPFVSKLEQLSASTDMKANDLPSGLSDVVAAINKLQSGIEINSSVIGRANESISALTNSISNSNSPAANNPATVHADYSGQFAGIVSQLQSLSAGVAAVNNTALDNVNAVNNVSLAVNAVEAALKSQQNSSAVVDANAITQAIISGVNPFITRLEDSGNSQQVSAANVSKNLLSLEQSIASLKSSTDSNVNAITSLQSSLSGVSSGGSGESFSGALVPLVNSVQSLNVAVSAIQNINQANSEALLEVSNAVKAVESVIKSINAGNNYDIDINQQGFIIEKKSDADNVARLTASALRSGLGNGGV